MSLPGSLLLLLAIMATGAISHIGYVHRISYILKKTTDSNFGRKDLLEALHIPQGSNFNTLMIFSWSLFLVALVFLYFLTPAFFPEYSYFKHQRLASSDLGFAVLGLVILIPSLVVSLLVPRVYSYYLISRWLKNLNLLTPFLLIVSIFCSLILGTIYPLANGFVWNAGYAALLFAEIFLLLPIVIGFAEEMRL